MKFKIEGIRKGKALDKFLELPPVLRNRLYYLRYFGGAMVPTIRHRWSKLSCGEACFQEFKEETPLLISIKQASQVNRSGYFGALLTQSLNRILIL